MNVKPGHQRCSLTKERLNDAAGAAWAAAEICSPEALPARFPTPGRARGASRRAGLLPAPSRQPPSRATRERRSLRRSAGWRSSSVKLIPANLLQPWDEGAVILSQYLSSQTPPLRLASGTSQRHPRGVHPCAGLAGTERWEMPGRRYGSRELPLQQKVLFISHMGTLIHFTYR